MEKANTHLFQSFSESLFLRLTTESTSADFSWKEELL